MNQDQKEGHSNENFTSFSAGSSGKQNERIITQTSGNKNLYDYFSENLQVISKIFNIIYYIFNIIY